MSTTQHGFMICASPRSGSTLLCDLLTQTGVAGSPKSYFRPDSIADFAGDDGATHSTNWDHRYVDRIRRQSMSDNGCFGFRIMWSDTLPFLRRIESLYPAVGRDRKRLKEALGVEHFVHLYRDDKVAQAVSLVIAQQTGTWHRNADGSMREGNDVPDPPNYDHEFIERELRMLEHEHASWARWFELQKIEPLAISYEALAEDPIALVESLLETIGVKDPVQPGRVLTSPLATELNKAWAEQFRNTM